jgi:hypothetical protein
LVAALLMAVSARAIDVTLETFNGTGPHSTFAPAPPDPQAISGLDEQFWIATGKVLDGAYDGLDSFDFAISPPTLPFLTRIDPGPGDLYQVAGDMTRSIGAGLGTGFTATIRYQDVVPGTAATNLVQTNFNFGNELGSDISLFELVGAGYDATAHALQVVVLIDAGVTKVISTSVPLGQPTGNPVDLEFQIAVGKDTVNGGSLVRVFGAADGGPLQALLIADGTTIATDLTNAANILASMQGVGAQFVPVMDPDPLVTGPSLAFEHFQIDRGFREIPEPASILLGLACLGTFLIPRSWRY